MTAGVLQASTAEQRPARFQSALVASFPDLPVPIVIALITLATIMARSSMIPIVVILCLLPHDEVHQVGREGSIFELFSPDGPFLADAAQPKNLNLAIDVGPVPPSETAEAPSTILGIAVASFFPVVVSVDRKDNEGKEDAPARGGAHEDAKGRRGLLLVAVAHSGIGHARRGLEPRGWLGRYRRRG